MKSQFKPRRKSSHAPKREKDEGVTAPVGSLIGSSTEYGFLVADRALPQTIDDAERDFGFDIYDRMANDAVLGGAEAYLKVLALSVDVHVTPSIEEPRPHHPEDKHAEFAKAKAAAEFCRAFLDRLAATDRPIRKILWDMLDAVHTGHRLAEIDSVLVKDGILAGKLVPSAIRPKPRKNYAFVLDTYNGFRGIIAVVPGVSTSLRNGIVYGLDQLPNAIAPSKLLILTMGGKDGDPRGSSWFRRAYDPWYRKQIVKPESVKTAVQFGGGMITAIAPQDINQVNVQDPVTGKTVHIQAAIQSILQQLSNGGTATFPGGTQIQVHRPDSDGKYFEDFFDRCDREMVTTFLLSGRAMLEARHGSKADTGASQDVVDDLIQFVRREICDMLTHRLFRPFVALNFGNDFAERYTPHATMLKMSRPDFAVNATAVASLVTAGYIDRSQLAEIDREILGLPERSDNSMKGDWPQSSEPQP